MGEKVSKDMTYEFIYAIKGWYDFAFLMAYIWTKCLINCYELVIQMLALINSIFCVHLIIKKGSKGKQLLFEEIQRLQLYEFWVTIWNSSSSPHQNSLVKILYS